jgi:hypothetical protein
MKPHLPISQSDFSVIRRRGDYYVDKSLYIKEVMDGADVLLVTRPRRFGKTLNTNMLYHFYRHDENSADLFEGLQIQNAEERYLRKMNQHPVIYLSFKDIKDADWESAAAGLWSNLYGLTLGLNAAYEQCQTALSAKEQGVLERFLAGKSERADLEHLLQSLCHLMNLQVGQKTVVLIDEYDTPIISAWLDGYFEDCLGFMRDLFSGLKDNAFLEKAVLSGVVRVSKESLFSGLNNLSVWSIFSEKASDKFGFTEEEVADLLASQGLNGEDLAKVRQWYNGYTIGSAEVYNPWSILSFADSPADGFRPYWANTSDNRLIRRLLFEGEGSVREDIEALLGGNWLQKNVTEHLVFQDLFRSKEAVWNLLLAAGYLKSRNLRFDESNLAYVCELAIPNQEVRYVYAESIRHWVGSQMPSSRFTDMVEYLIKGQMEAFENLLHDFLMGVASVHDTAKPQTENFYHAFFLGILGHFSDRFILKSNRESGLGRYDIAMFPRNQQDPGIVLEIKTPRVPRNESLEQALDLAIAQLKSNTYSAELKAHGCSKIKQVALAVAGKNFSVRVLEEA